MSNTLGSIKPELVMCGVDLTDAKSSNLQASQDIAEWKTYRDIVSSRWENLLWLDIRGNHDNLDVLSRNSSNNYFARFSVNLGSYAVPWQIRDQKWCFLISPS